MTYKCIALVFVCLLTFMVPNEAQADIFLSFSNFGEGNAAGNNMTTASAGDHLSAFIWVEDDFRIDTGAFLDVRSTDSSVIRFIGSEVFNPSIQVSGTTIDSRWEEIGGGSVSSDLVDEMHGFLVLDGTGVLPSQVTGGTFEDQLHDSGSGAFLFGRVDFEVIGSGSTDLELSVGNGLIVDDGVALSPTFRSATVTAVPEPGTYLLMSGLSMLCLCLQRRTRFRHSFISKE